MTSHERGRSGVAIVVLGCRVAPDGRPSAALERRIHWAAAAHRAGLSDSIIASGGRSWGPHVEGLCIRRALEAAGVESVAIYPELCSLTTAENAFFSARIAVALGVSRVLIATCSWHAPRALACFERVGLHARSLDAPPPPARPRELARRAVHEWVSRRLDRRHLDRMLAGDPAAHPFRHPADAVGGA